MSGPGPEHLSDLALDGVRLGGPHADGAAAAHLEEGCARCADRLAVLRADAAAFEARFSPASLAAQALERRRPSGRFAWGRATAWLGGLAAVGAAAVLAVVAVPPPQGPAAPAADLPGDRTKGAAAEADGAVGLEVRMRRGGEVREVRSGATFRSGDALMVRLNPGPHRRVRLVYQDTGKSRSVWYAAELPPGRWTWTDRSFVLDGAIGREVLTAEFADTPDGPAQATVRFVILKL